MAAIRVVAPKLERILSIAGGAHAPVRNLTLRGLAFAATTTPLKPGGFGAYAFDGAIHAVRTVGCVFENLDIGGVAGQAFAAAEMEDGRISGCHIHDVGACGIKASGSATVIASNHIHHVGRHHLSAVALSVSHVARPSRTNGFHVVRNEIHDAPYTGIIGGGGDHRIEQNVIHRVMRELHDGGAIYGGMKRSVIRENVVRDVVKIGEGYGVSA